MEILKPKLSVILTTHRRPDLLDRALKSILKRSKNDFEIVLCCDGGDKATFDVACNNLRDNDIFLRVPYMKGPADSRNIGIKTARAKWICFLDDDDSFGEQHIQNFIDIVDKNQETVYYVNYQKQLETRGCKEIEHIDSTNVDISNIHVGSLLIKNFIPINAMFFPANILKDHSFDCRLQSHEDWDFIISLLEAGAKFQWIQSPEDSVKVHFDSSVTTRNKANFVHLDYLSIYRKWPSSDQEIQNQRARKISKLGIVSVSSKSL